MVDEETSFEDQVKDKKDTYSNNGQAGSMSSNNQTPAEKEKLPQEMSEKVRKEMEKTRTELEKLKKEFVKKYSFIRAIGILPQQGVFKFVEEEFTSKEDIERVSKM